MLQGEKMLLRAVERDDLELLHGWWNDPGLSHLMGERRHVSSIEETEAWFEAELEKTEPNEGRTFAIATPDGKAIGTIRYGPYDTRDRACDVSLYLGDAGNRGKGLGTAALGILLGYLFEDLGLNRVRLYVHPDNAGAIRCYEKVGFVREGVCRQMRYFAGRFHDFILMSVLACDWKGDCKRHG